MKQYRTLNDGELVMEGDEFWGIDRSWIQATEIGKKVTSYTHKMYRRPLTETSSQTTDTCPDCSNEVCDCGIPAGYTPTPRTDERKASFASDTIRQLETELAAVTKERDRLAEAFQDMLNDTLTPTNDEWIVTDNENYIEIASIKTCDSIASVHGGKTIGDQYDLAGRIARVPQLERELTAAREELAELKEEYGTWWAQKRIAIDELKEVTEQRDRLAGGLKWIAGWNHQLFDENTAMQMRDKAEQALQSLNPDHTVAANDMTAAVKGGSDES